MHSLPRSIYSFPIAEIARETRLSRPTVRRALNGEPVRPWVVERLREFAITRGAQR